jgi:hypothetical protein
MFALLLTWRNCNHCADARRARQAVCDQMAENGDETFCRTTEPYILAVSRPGRERRDKRAWRRALLNPLNLPGCAGFQILIQSNADQHQVQTHLFHVLGASP